MRISNKTLFVGFIICLVSLTCGEDTTTDATTKTITTTTTSSTSTTSSSTNPTTSTTQPSTSTTKPSTSTTQPSTSTTASTSTTSSTSTISTTTVKPVTSTSTAPPIPTTTTPVPETVFNFTIPKNTSEPTCLRAKFSLALDIKYLGLVNNQTVNLTLPYVLKSIDDYDGECNAAYNTLLIKFENDWSLLFNYTLNNKIYQLDMIKFDYTVDRKLFVNADNSSIGPHSTDQTNVNEFSAGQDNSYKCKSETTIDLKNGVSLNFTEYQAEPFSGKDKKDFDTAVECAADLTGTSKLVPIIVGSALAVLVLLVLVAYIIGRRKHRPGYQQV